ncbi:ABC transporter permease [Kineococcus aurantiacus]|uniref:Ribose/xylose/arabinose/galactoside ABC-type transport system permease subunit n=1 Tax=Kineococcus aurantiacus TaxID=37633 RepID=A0A7Y9J3A7_9ACTN|nr:ABC transporter permease [Kineococcus aurantiacus]NYD24818.1 ribose/xylose/arabinose/galactoside ABC-type transport system permease subunit [Kineococcus aurantiacus]
MPASDSPRTHRPVAPPAVPARAAADERARPTARTTFRSTLRTTSRAGALRRLGLWLVLAVVVAVLSIVSPTFRSTFNLQNVLEQNALIGVVACGMTIMMISGGFDLSVGATGATAAVTGAAVANLGWGTVPTVAAALLVGLVVGLVNGVLIARLRINAFVTTFAMASVVLGLLFVSTGAQSIPGGTPALQWAATGRLGPVPVSFVLFAACLLVVWLLLTRTKFGHYVHAVGGNAQASRLSGVPVELVQIASFALGGVFASAGGLILLGQTSVGQPSAAADWPLRAIAVCVVGGVALTGGVGRIEDVLAATLLLGVIANGMNQLGIASDWQPIVTGLVILVAVVLDQHSRRKRVTAPAPAPAPAATPSPATGTAPRTS